MKLQPTKDEGELLPDLSGMLICVLDTRGQIDTRFE